MQPILVAYGTTEGQTRKIAEFIAERLRIRGHRVDLVDTATPAAQQLGASYQAAIVGGSLHQQRHQRSLEHFLKDNRVWLDAMPLALFFRSWHLRRRLIRAGCCPECGYDLRATPHGCPESGAIAFSASVPSPASPALSLAPPSAANV